MRPYLRAANVTWDGLDLSDVNEMNFPPGQLETFRLQADDILLSEASGSASEVGKPALWRGQIENCCFQNTLIRVRSSGPDPRFLLLHFKADAELGRFSKAARGVGIHHLGAKAMEEWPIQLAPFGEQGRIVDEVEKQFTRLDAAVAGLQRIKANLKRYRASVLKAACEGRLVPTEAELARREGRSFESGEELLKRILKERRARWEADQLAKMKAAGKVPRDDSWKRRYEPAGEPEAEGLWTVPDGWAWATAGLVIWGIEAGASFKCDEVPPEAGQTGVVKVSAVTWGTYNEREAKTCTDSARVDDRLLIRKGDFLFSRANTIDLVGACVIARRVESRVMLSDKILRFHLGGIPGEWLLLILRSRWGRREIEALATGNQESMRNIGQERIQRIRVPLPPLPEQHRIVAEVERRLSVVDELEATVEKNLARCARLRQAILKMAFEGRLVPQYPNDEPASVLLDRIRRQRGSAEMASAAPRRRKAAKR
jgi:type I restriction enzyme S subunit